MSVATPIPSARPAADAHAAPPAAPVRPARAWLVYAILAVIVGGHLVDMLFKREHWPFSDYPMWAFPSKGWEVKREMLRGVTDEPTPREVALVPKELDPIPYQMVVVNMQKASRAVREGKPAEADRIIGGLLAHYNNRVSAGKNIGPKLAALRLYQVTWKMDTDASEASKRSPIGTALLYPVWTDAQRAAAVPPVAARIVSEFGDGNNGDD